LDLSAGTYSVTVNAVADATGSYSFRLINADQATPIVAGTAVTGTLDPANQTNVYQFTANAGDRFYFGVNSVTGVLTPLAGSPFSVTNPPTAFATDANGRLFMAQGSNLDVFTTASGIPTGVSGNPFSAGLGFGTPGFWAAGFGPA